jgi:hypothetical protein
MTDRTHIVQAGETLHGIVKRLTGSACPGELAGWRHRLEQFNNLPVAYRAKLGDVLKIPSDFPASPRMDVDSSAGQQRIQIIAATEAEELHAQNGLLRAELVEAQGEIASLEHQLRQYRWWLSTCAGALAGMSAALIVISLWMIYSPIPVPRLESVQAAD